MYLCGGSGKLSAGKPLHEIWHTVPLGRIKAHNVTPLTSAPVSLQNNETQYTQLGIYNIYAHITWVPESAIFEMSTKNSQVSFVLWLLSLFT